MKIGDMISELQLEEEQDMDMFDALFALHFTRAFAKVCSRDASTNPHFKTFVLDTPTHFGEVTNMKI